MLHATEEHIIKLRNDDMDFLLLLLFTSSRQLFVERLPCPYNELNSNK
jgi:hypothetical protein